MSVATYPSTGKLCATCLYVGADATTTPTPVTSANPLYVTAAVTSVIPGTAATSLGKAIDSAAGATDTGIASLVVRDDALTTLTPADGDYTHLRVDSTGALWVAVGSISLPTGASTLAEQQTQTTALQIIDDWDESDRAKVNPIVGQAGVQGGSGAVSALTQRVVLATDVALPAGTNAIGKLAANSGVDIGDVDVTSCALPTGASTLAEQQSQTTHLATIAGDTTDIEAAVELIDDTIVTLGTDTYTEATSKGQVMGAVRRDADTPLANTTNEFSPLITDANGYLKVEIFDGGGSHTIDDGAGSITVDYATTGSGTATGALRVELANNGTGTLATLSTLTTLTGGNIAHDGVDSGNPHKIGAKASSSPKGITLVADADRTDLLADVDGIQMVKLNTSNDDVISERVSNTDGASTASSGFGAVASTHNCITAFQVFRTDAGTTPIYIDFRDGTAGAILWSAVIPAGGGSNSPSCCGPFLFRTSQNTALAYDVSAATTTVFISVSGYQSKS